MHHSYRHPASPPPLPTSPSSPLTSPSPSVSCGDLTQPCLCQPPLRPASSSSSSSCSLCPPASRSPSAVRPAAPQTCGHSHPACCPPPSLPQRLTARATGRPRGTSAKRCRFVDRASCFLCGSPTGPGWATRWPGPWFTSSRSCTCSWASPSSRIASWRPSRSSHRR